MEIFESLKKLGEKSLDSGVEIAKKLLQYQEKVGNDAIKIGKDALKYINDISEKSKDQGITMGKDGDFSVNFGKLLNSLNQEQKAMFEMSFGTVDALCKHFKEENPKILNDELEHKIVDELNKTLVYSKIKYVMNSPLVDKYKTPYDVFCEMTEAQQLGYNAALSQQFKELFNLPMVIVRTYVRPLNDKK